MRITALSRGGLGVFGGHYDPHKDSAILTMRQGESRTITIEYASSPSEVAISTSGFTTTAPVISGNKASFNVSGVSDRGLLDITAIVGGEVRDIRIRAVIHWGSGTATIVSADDGTLDYSDPNDAVYIGVL